MSVAPRLLTLLLLAAPFVASADDEPLPEPPKRPEDARVVAGLDINWFQQADGGGNPVQREGVRYLGQRAYLNAQLNETVRLRTAVAVAKLEDGGSDDSVDFSQISNATMTEPSQNQTPVAVDLFADITPQDSAVTVTPGVYFFHQSDYQSIGASVDLSWKLNGGDTSPFVGLRFLHDSVELNYWDGSDRGDDNRFTLSLLAGVTQTLTSRLVTSASLQYVHQQGFLGDPINVVPINTNGIPTFLADERLPNQRDRFQLNGRVRYALWKGWSLGLDLSGYLDSWSVQHAAVEPNVEMSLVEGVWILRLWYRLALQGKARYYSKTLTEEQHYQTTDSDLGTFTVHTVGAHMIVRSPHPIFGVFPEVHGHIFYYDRNDGVDGLSFSTGMAVRF